MRNYNEEIGELCFRSGGRLVKEEKEVVRDGESWIVVISGRVLCFVGVWFAGVVLGSGYIVVLDLTLTEGLDLSLFSLIVLVRIMIVFGVCLLGHV